MELNVIHIKKKKEVHSIKSRQSAIVGQTQGPQSLRQEIDYSFGGNVMAVLAYTVQLNFQKIHNAVREPSSGTT